MNFDELQAEISSDADAMNGVVAFALFARVQELMAANAIGDVDSYSALMRVYANMRVYYHRMRKRIESAYTGDGIGLLERRHYSYWVKERDKCEFYFQQIKNLKKSLRERLRAAGINPRQFHPNCVSVDLKMVNERLRFNAPALDLC